MIYTMDSIPWQQITTAYGMGTEVPELIKTGQYKKLSDLIEHQGTLWQTTPWVLLILLQRLEQHPEQISNEEIQLYWAVASVIPVEGLDAGTAVTSMNDLLAEVYLWPVDDNDQDWEQEEPRGYDPVAFHSYYYYSYMLLKDALTLFKRAMDRTDLDTTALQQLIQVLEGTSQ